MVIGYVLDTRRATRKDYPVKIRVSYNQRADYYSTGLYMSKAVFKALSSHSPGPQTEAARD